MCACISDLLRVLGLFQSPVLPSFFDGSLSVNHDYDQELRDLFRSITIPPTFREYNPSPEDEMRVFNACLKKGEMIQRNILLMSRHFIGNAIRFGLREQFLDKAVIRVLDVGCGLAPTLPGLLVYFQKVGIRVEYLGLDLQADLVSECRQAYECLAPDVAFTCMDLQDLFDNGQYRHQYDLVLCQHPNIQSLYSRAAFETLFLRHQDLLSMGGIFYSTIYYASEKKHLEQEVLPKMTDKLRIADRDPGISLTSGAFGRYFPERYVCISEPRGLSLLPTP